KYDNLFVARSFSKGYGLPGLRIGYMACSKSLLAYYDLAHEPHNNNVIGLKAALLSLKDNKFMTKSIKKISEEKQRFINSLSCLNILETSSKVPILALQHPNKNTDLYKMLIEN